MCGKDFCLRKSTHTFIHPQVNIDLMQGTVLIIHTMWNRSEDNFSGNFESKNID